MAIIIYICFALALANNLLDIGNEDKDNIFERALIIFRDSLAGPDPPADGDDEGLRYAYWFLIFLLLLISTTIGFNLLIAIISDVFDKIQLERSYYDAVQKFSLLNELNDIYMFGNYIYMFWSKNAIEEP